VRPVNDVLMRTNHVPLGYDHQPLRINAQADGTVRKAGGYRITGAIKADQAGRRDALSFLDKAVEHCGERHQRRLLGLPNIGDATRQSTMSRLSPQQLTVLFQSSIQHI